MAGERLPPGNLYAPKDDEHLTYEQRRDGE